MGFQVSDGSLCGFQEKQAATNRILLKKERASGFQDSRLDVVARFNGSTEALDRLEDPPTSVAVSVSSAGAAAARPGDAVSPTVSQLSAVFEKSEQQNNLYLQKRRSAPALAPKPKLPVRADGAERKVRLLSDECQHVFKLLTERLFLSRRQGPPQKGKSPRRRQSQERGGRWQRKHRNQKLLRGVNLRRTHRQEISPSPPPP